MTFGIGAPPTSQNKVTSFPSKTVRFSGPFDITGGDAMIGKNIEKINYNLMIYKIE